MEPRKLLLNTSKQSDYDKRFHQWKSKWKTINPHKDVLYIRDVEAQKFLTLLADYSTLFPGILPYKMARLFQGSVARNYTSEVRSVIKCYFAAGIRPERRVEADEQDPANTLLDDVNEGSVDLSKTKIIDVLDRMNWIEFSPTNYLNLSLHEHGDLRALLDVAYAKAGVKQPEPKSLFDDASPTEVKKS